MKLSPQFVGKKMLARFGDFWGRFGEVFYGVSVVVSTYGSLSSSLMASSRWVHCIFEYLLDSNFTFIQFLIDGQELAKRFIAIKKFKQV